VINFPTFNSQPLRHVEIDGVLWFAAPDACRCLGMDVAKGTYKWLVGLTGDERRIINRHEYPQLGWGKGAPTLAVVSEPGLYRLISRSEKPEAKMFDRWVRHEVLPSIRQTGGYLLNEHARETAHADTKEAMPISQHPWIMKRAADPMGRLGRTCGEENLRFRFGSQSARTSGGRSPADRCSDLGPLSDRETPRVPSTGRR